MERVIRANRPWFRIDWAGLRNYRDLLFLLVRRDFVARYQQTILGPMWFICQPLVTTLAFTLILGKALGAPTDGVPPFLFYQCGMLGWFYFSNVVGTTGDTFGTNASLLTKVYFPRLIIPLSTVISSLATLGVQMATFLVLYLGYFLRAPAAASLHPNFLALAALPAVILMTAALSLGVGLFTSALSAKYRDMQFILPFLVQIWMYATPVIYPLSHLGPRAKWAAAINPMTTVVECLRLGFFGRGTVTAGFVLVSVAFTLTALVAGLCLFQHSERTFADTV